MRKICFLGFLVLFGCQGTGTLVINSKSYSREQNIPQSEKLTYSFLDYGPTLYKSLGFTTVSQLLIQSGWVSVCPFGNAINSVLVDRVGRTRLLVIGFTGVVTALIGECITVSVFQQTGSRSVAGAAVFFLFWHMVCFSSTSDATSYIYASEIFPTPLRAKGLAVSVSGLFVATIIFLQAAPTAFAAIGWKYYLVFLIISALVAVIVYFFYPEVRHKTFTLSYKVETNDFCPDKPALSRTNWRTIWRYCGNSKHRGKDRHDQEHHCGGYFRQSLVSV
jgi:MFS family permease